MITFVFQEHTVANAKVLEKEPLRNACFPIAKPLKTSEITDPLTLFAPCEKSLKRCDSAKTPVSSTFR